MTRRQILEDLQTQLETITTANGYQTEIGAKVTYWDTYNSDYKGPETVTFRDYDTEYQFNNQNYITKLSVDIEAVAYIKENKIAESTALYEDLKTALVLTRWSEDLINVRPIQDTKEIASLGKTAVLFTLTLEIEYREDQIEV